VGKWSAGVAASQLAAVVKPGVPLKLYLNLLAAERRRENHGGALAWARKAAAEHPGEPLAALWWGQCALGAQGFAEAEQAFRAGIELQPEWWDLYNCLGLALQGLARHGEAIRVFTKANELKPAEPAPLIHLAEAFLEVNDVASSLATARKLVELRPRDAAGHMLLAQALVGDNQSIEAEGEAALAVELDPVDPVALGSHGSTLLTLGKMAAADARSRAAVAIQPNLGIGYFNLVRSHRITESDRPLVDQMKAAAQEKDLGLGHRTLLGFALGKALEDLGEYKDAMGRYDEANRLDYLRKFGAQPFDMDLNLVGYERSRDLYPASLLAKANADSTPEPLPIFVFGMMRSGTTLLEQILSSHSAVGAAGEQRFWLANRSAAFTPEASLDHGRLDALRAEYLESLRKISPGMPMVVDKMPTNTMNVGLLQLAFPSAPLIHIRRDPIDTCLSIYATHNRVPIPWANSKENIALNYRRYLDLMEYWRRVLPPGRMLDVQYEELVEDPRPVIERILDYCRLPWEDACLHHERNERAVVTPSLWQVRQPIYRTSVARWRRFEPWLGALAELHETEPASR